MSVYSIGPHFNISFQTGTFPKMLKKARIKPLNKSKDRKNIQNYRSISILSVFSKPLEKLMYNRLLIILKEALHTNKLTSWIQSKQIYRDC